MAFDIEMIRRVYKNMVERVDHAKSLTGRPLSLTEKILYSHLWDGLAMSDFQRGNAYVDFAPDRVAMSRCNGPNGTCFNSCRQVKEKVAVPTTAHC